LRTKFTESSFLPRLAVLGASCRKWVPSSNSHDNPAVYLYPWGDSHIAWRIAPLYRLQDHAAYNSRLEIHYNVLGGTKRDEQLLVHGSTGGSTEHRILTHRELDRHFSIGLINKKTEFGIPWCGLGWGPLALHCRGDGPLNENKERGLRTEYSVQSRGHVALLTNLVCCTVSLAAAGMV
jgi:hypothetical protein